VTPTLWFFDHGFHVFPVHGKEPAVPKGTSQFDYRCTRAQAAHLKNYGVPLGLLAVVDTDALDVEAWVAAHAPPTPFMVRTARGWHRYYRLITDAPHFIHRDGHTIEFRHRGAYVIGPGSRHLTGAIYTADEWSWVITDIPFFPVADFVWDDRPIEARGSIEGNGYEFPTAVYAGERHDQLFRLLRSGKGRGWDRETVRDLVSLANHDRCHPPLEENEQFEQWFTRQWNKPDRPLPRLEPEVAVVDWDLDSPGGDV